MPELPEVETVVRGLRPGVLGKRIIRCVHASPLMVVCEGGDFARAITGRVIRRVDRQGKWIFCRLDDGRTLVLHLGMTGFLRTEKVSAPVEGHTHLRLLLAGGKEELRMRDPRRFGEIVLMTAEAHADRFGAGKLGPDALEVDGDYLAESFGATKRGIKNVLLDQRVIAGIGNIYADEILFSARVHPARRADRLRRAEVEEIALATGTILRQAIELGGSTIRDYLNAEGTPGWFQWHHQAYGRAGEACKRCEGRIVLARDIASGRSTHFCPKCQPKRISGMSRGGKCRKISSMRDG